MERIGPSLFSHRLGDQHEYYEQPGEAGHDIHAVEKSMIS
jgi:hypothetical protein